jgi:CBS domain-containing protein
MEKVLKKQVKDFMTKDVIAVSKNQTLKQVFKLMEKSAVLGLPVVDEDARLEGIVTESDLIRHFTTLETPTGINLLGGIVYLDDISEFNRSLKDHCAEYVRDIMTKEVVTIKEDDNLLSAINTMTEHHLTRLPVLDENNKVVGIITRSDIVHQLSKISTP